MGYDLAPTDPGPGSVVALDAAGKGIVLTSGADRPEEYVASIGARLESLAAAAA
jgi:hypothetical protein